MADINVYVQEEATAVEVENLAKLIRGDDGVGVASVEQTTTSTEDGGANVMTVTLTDGTVYNFSVRNGNKGSTGDKGNTGEKGDTGNDGVSPTIEVNKTGKVTTLAITDANGTKTVTINDGADGEDGELTGSVDWNSVTNKPEVISCTHSWDGTVLTITSASGTSSANLKGEPGTPGTPGTDGYTPVKGTDYWTETDVQEMVNDVLAALPNASGVGF